jgi:undecaprenyl-diphosphatase
MQHKLISMENYAQITKSISLEKYGIKKRSSAIFWLLWASVIAYSRVYNGVHYPSDVLVGGFIGALFGFLCFKFYKFSLLKLKWN